VPSSYTASGAAELFYQSRVFWQFPDQRLPNSVLLMKARQDGEVVAMFTDRVAQWMECLRGAVDALSEGLSSYFYISVGVFTISPNGFAYELVNLPPLLQSCVHHIYPLACIHISLIRISTRIPQFVSHCVYSSSHVFSFVCTAPSRHWLSGPVYAQYKLPSVCDAAGHVLMYYICCA
jgi:hypothetical protein